MMLTFENLNLEIVVIAANIIHIEGLSFSWRGKGRGMLVRGPAIFWTSWQLVVAEGVMPRMCAVMNYLLKRTISMQVGSGCFGC